MKKDLTEISKCIKIIISKIESLTSKIFLFGTSFVLLLLVQSIILASFNFFRLIPVVVACIISLIISSYFLFVIRKEVNLFPKIPLLLVLILISISAVLIFYPHDNSGGTDNGTYIGLATYLAKNGSINTPSYLDGIPPHIEFNRTNLHGYSIWLATQNLLFGPFIMIRGNLLLILFGFLSFFSVSSMIKDKKMGLMTVALFATCMPLLWFSRETMTENLAFFLLWTVVFFFIAFFKTRQRIFIFYLILTAFLLPFTRSEGLFISFFTLIAFISFVFYKKVFSKKSFPFVIIGSSLAIIASFFIVYKTFNFSSANRTVLQAIKVIQRDIFHLFDKSPYLINKYPLFFSQMLMKYDLFLPVFFIFIALLVLFFSKNKSPNNFYFLVPVIIISIEFSKLIDPSIQNLQPWFYRRYLYALFPLGYLSLSFVLCSFKNKRITIVLFSLFFIINLVLSYPIIFLKHNWPLQTVMNKITDSVSRDDIVIIKDSYILGYYYPQYYLMLQKSIRAIYTFDMDYNDLSLKNKTYKGHPFENLYYLSDSPNDKYKDFLITNRQSFNVIFSQLKPSCELVSMVYESGIKDFKNYSAVPYSFALNYCKNPYNEIVKFNKQLYLYQLKV